MKGSEKLKSEIKGLEEKIKQAEIDKVTLKNEIELLYKSIQDFKISSDKTAETLQFMEDKQKDSNRLNGSIKRWKTSIETRKSQVKQYENIKY